MSCNCTSNQPCVTFDKLERCLLTNSDQVSFFRVISLSFVWTTSQMVPGANAGRLTHRVCIVPMIRSNGTSWCSADSAGAFPHISRCAGHCCWKWSCEQKYASSQFGHFFLVGRPHTRQVLRRVLQVSSSANSEALIVCILLIVLHIASLLYCALNWTQLPSERWTSEHRV
mgnify:CR=1 FL=1